MLKHITIHLPSERLDNSKLCAELGRWTPEEVFAKTGIHSRCIAPIGTTATDLARNALVSLQNECKETGNPVDFLIYCTQSPEYKIPASACILQAAAELPTTCAAVDINHGCSGFIYGLALGEGILSSGIAQNVAVVTSETYTHYLHPKDAVSRPIFGDGAAATLLSKNEGGRIHSFVFGTDGNHATKLYLPAGGSRLPEYSSVKTVENEESVAAPEYLRMNGPEIFNFTLQVVPRLVEKILKQEGTKFEEIDYFVFHQANAFMLESLRRKIKIPSEKFIVDMSDTGNLVSASIPVVLHKMKAKGLLNKPTKLLLCGFGTGLSWAGCILEHNPS